MVAHHPATASASRVSGEELPSADSDLRRGMGNGPIFTYPSLCEYDTVFPIEWPLTTRSSTFSALHKEDTDSDSPEVYYLWHGAADRKSITYFPRRETSTSDYPTLPWGRTWHVYRRQFTYIR